MFSSFIDYQSPVPFLSVSKSLRANKAQKCQRRMLAGLLFVVIVLGNKKFFRVFARLCLMKIS